MPKIDKSYSMTAEDCLKVAGEDTRIVVYDELANVEDIDMILNSETPKMMLLYKTHNGMYNNVPFVYGHWCSLLRWISPEGRDSITFFNSYGGREGEPDGTLQYISEDYKEESNQMIHYLNNLLRKSSCDIHYLYQKHQKHEKNNNTCGFHSSFFLRQSDTLGGDPEDYNKMMVELKKMLKLKSTDDLIVMIVNNFLKH